MIHHMKNKTPEEMRAIRMKGVETRRRNKARDEFNQIAADPLIREMSAIIDKIEKHRSQEEVLTKAFQISGRYLLTEDQIVEQSEPVTMLSGVYFLVNKGRVVYVGQSTNVFSRLAQHWGKEHDQFCYVPCEPENLDRLESLYIHYLKPELNASAFDGAKIAPISLDRLFDAENKKALDREAKSL